MKRTEQPSKWRSLRGVGLLEMILTILVLSIVGLALVGLIKTAGITSFKAREQMTCARMTQAGFSRLKNIDFYYLFEVDSSSDNYGLPAAPHPGWINQGVADGAYPYLATLNGILTTLQDSKFDRFRVLITFMRRDTTDQLGTGMTSNLIPFTNNNGSGCDKYDPNICYNDIDGDGDDYEYFYNPSKTSEQPDTHIKRVTLEIYRQGRLACSQTELISLEQFSGQYNPSSEALIKLLISTPSAPAPNVSYVYSLQSPDQQASHNLAITNAYPSAISQTQYPTDYDPVAGNTPSIPLNIAGKTDAAAQVSFYVGGQKPLATVSPSSDGTFSASPKDVTKALVEGANTLSGIATKNAFSSPIAQRNLIFDTTPPIFNGPAPTGTVSLTNTNVNTFSPYVAISFFDNGTSTTATSGICPDVTAMKFSTDGGVTWSAANFRYTPVSGAAVSSGTLMWLDPVTVVPILSSNTVYTVAAEGGDYASYKASATWTFTLNVPSEDGTVGTCSFPPCTTPPTISNQTPTGLALSDLPTISAQVSDPNSGIDPRSILLVVDGTTVISSGSATNISAYFGDIPAYDPATGTVSYAPSTAFAAGSTGHTVDLKVKHWAPPQDPSHIQEASWSFDVP